MFSKNKSWLKRFDKIGFRLNLVLFTVLGFYLLTNSYSIYTLWQQAHEFKTLSHVHFERAMYASELSRDTERLSAQTLEKIIGQEYSNTNSYPISENFQQFFNAIRQKISANSELEQTFINEIDLLSAQYFDSIISLDNHLFENEKLNRETAEIKQRLMVLQSNQIKAEASETVNPSYHEIFTNIVSTTVLALYSESLGQSNKLRELNEENIKKLFNMEGLNETLSSRIQEIKGLSELTFAINKQKIHHSLAILGSARQTRLAAQRLSSACFEFYLSLKNATTKASNEHAKLINKVIFKILIFSLAFLMLTIIAYWFIQHYIIRRLNSLSQIITEHINGKAVNIPKCGKDEISVIARAFSIFVDSINKANSESVKAQKDVEEANEKLHALNESLQLISHTDDLTKIANRRHFFQSLAESWEQAEKTQSQVSIIMLDLDYFKLYNDFYGHQEGDRCLREIAQLFKSYIDKVGGKVARYGGEEFIALLIGMSKEETYTLANALKDSVFNNAFPHEKSPLDIVTISVGIATQLPDAGNTPEQLISMADVALYEAKNSGRNKVCGMAISD
ncbi:diguanylate cyclase domain-containing protein [Marinomonas algicola]|uniref:diguanylate cyclase domain-containing protein n=1 Tax=Marinomonas algicola TaxID=2773454 RepID=UPI00174EA892|nr:diguanylate cyclase [Marinomonas algicola]